MGKGGASSRPVVKAGLNWRSAPYWQQIALAEPKNPRTGDKLLARNVAGVVHLARNEEFTYCSFRLATRMNRYVPGAYSNHTSELTPWQDYTTLERYFTHVNCQDCLVAYTAGEGPPRNEDGTIWPPGAKRSDAPGVVRWVNADGSEIQHTPTTNPYQCAACSQYLEGMFMGEKKELFHNNELVETQAATKEAEKSVRAKATKSGQWKCAVGRHDYATLGPTGAARETCTRCGKHALPDNDRYW